MGRFYCWKCELWFGDESDPIEATKLCAACREFFQTQTATSTAKRIDDTDSVIEE